MFLSHRKQIHPPHSRKVSACTCVVVSSLVRSPSSSCSYNYSYVFLKTGAGNICTVTHFTLLSHKFWPTREFCEIRDQPSRQRLREETDDAPEQLEKLRVAHDHIESFSCFHEESTELAGDLGREGDQRSIAQEKCIMKPHVVAVCCISLSFVVRCEHDFPHGSILNE